MPDMPTWHRIDDDKYIYITAYYTASRIVTAAANISTIAEAQAPIADQEAGTRWPVRNREPRTPISSLKRAIIHERDGHACRYCAAGGILVVDHIIPRSAFPADQLHIADRSDNLHSACWECNEERSNFETFHTKRIGVVTQCLACQPPQYNEATDEITTEQLHEGTPVPVYCGRCGISQQTLDWVA